ncbi:hypothetical protein C0Q70_12158 [Pomacea canaliculata]|uniref:OTU domain-containing protein n=1 Tax=Pomacea canaliculata TaxID=400727 RepID=A0A2T7P0Q8_POMCA|nr:hypothetical protein C0Q70_12158 [Pomacea canaliculata]
MTGQLQIIHMKADEEIDEWEEEEEENQVDTLMRRAEKPLSVGFKIKLCNVTVPELFCRLASLERQVDYIKGDGNCFFRALSKEIYGSENFHAEWREAVVDVIDCHPLVFRQYVDTNSVESHVQEMRRLGTWATTCEIYAAAMLLQRDIYVLTPNHTGKEYHWLLFSPRQLTGPSAGSSVCTLNTQTHERAAGEITEAMAFLDMTRKGQHLLEITEAMAFLDMTRKGQHLLEITEAMAFLDMTRKGQHLLEITEAMAFLDMTRKGQHLLEITEAMAFLDMTRKGQHLLEITEAMAFLDMTRKGQHLLEITEAMAFLDMTRKGQHLLEITEAMAFLDMTRKGQHLLEITEAMAFLDMTRKGQHLLEITEAMAFLDMTRKGQHLLEITEAMAFLDMTRKGQHLLEITEAMAFLDMTRKGQHLLIFVNNVPQGLKKTQIRYFLSVLIDATRGLRRPRNMTIEATSRNLSTR